MKYLILIDMQNNMKIYSNKKYFFKKNPTHISITSPFYFKANQNPTQQIALVLEHHRLTNILRNTSTLTGGMVRTSTTTLYISATNTRFPKPPLNLQFCHNATKILSLKNPLPLINKHPFLQYSHHHHHQKNPTSGAINFRSLVIKASSSSMASSTKIKPFSVLFVCLGNICRSPAAEGVFTDIVEKRGLDSEFKIDSAGTIDYHEVHICF
jgi:protein-tyrosine phosphatase